MKMTAAVLVILSGMVMSLSSSAQTTDRGLAVERAHPKSQRWAVVIGVNYYQDDGIGSLSFAVPDALLMEKALVEGGFPADHILVLCDEQTDPALRPTLENFRDRLQQWLNLVGPDDTVVVFFSGHGFLDKDGNGFLAPSGCRSNDLAGTSMSMTEMNALLTKCQARRYSGKRCARGDKRGRSHEGFRRFRRTHYDCQLSARAEVVRI
jgi:uncharacterized caspase-like protein